MTENQFDEFFRKKLGDYASPVPEDMWRRIKQKKDKERRTLLILLLSLLMVGGTTSYFVFEGRTSSRKENIASSQKQTNPSINNPTQNKNQKNETITTQKDSIILSLENEVSSLDNRSEKSSEPGSNKNNSLVTNESSSNKIGRGVIKNDNTKANQEKNVVNKNSSDEMNRIKQTPAERNFEQQKNDQANEVAKPNDITTPNEVITQNQSTVAEQNDQNKLSQKDSSQQKLQNKESSKEITIKTHSPIIKNLFVEVYVSPDIPVSKTSSNNADYLRHKDSTSQMKLSYTFGVRIGAALGEHFTVKTGFQYSDINEKFDYLNKNATRTVPVVITRTLTNSSGETMTLLDTSNFMQVGKDYKLSYNHYQSIDIPIMIGYETSGERLIAAFNTGIILNLKTGYKGEILDASLNAADINSYNVYKNNTGISLYFGLGVSTKLNDNLRLFTEPYVRYRLNSMTGKPEPFSQKINVSGLSLGLRYNF